MKKLDNNYMNNNINKIKESESEKYSFKPNREFSLVESKIKKKNNN
jgi:hypothetical protein